MRPAQRFWLGVSAATSATRVTAKVRSLSITPKGKGSRLTDVDGNEYIDYALANGPAILGHAPKAVLDAVAESLGVGQLFAGQTESEALLARQLVDIIRCAERIRFASCGTEAVQTAIRLSRAHTGRAKEIKFEGHYRRVSTR